GVCRVSSEGEQLWAGKTMRDVDRAAAEAIEPLRIVGLDLDIDLANRRTGTPVTVERREVDGTAVIPSLDPIRAAARSWLLWTGRWFWSSRVRPWKISLPIASDVGSSIRVGSSVCASSASISCRWLAAPLERGDPDGAGVAGVQELASSVSASPAAQVARTTIF